MSSSSNNEGEEFGGTMDVFRRENRATLQFKLPLYTQWGQNLLLVGSDPLLGSWDLARAKHMLPRHEGDAQLIWEVGVSVPANFHSQYSYCMVDEHMNVLKWEAGARRSLELPEGLENGAVVEVHDQWQDGSSPDALLQTSAFKNVIFRKDHHASERSTMVQFKVNCVQLEPGQSVFVVGNIPELGEWDDGAALPLSSSVGDDFLWQCMTTVRRENFPIHYKYILKNRFGEVVSETGADRELKCDSARKPAAMVITSDGSFQAQPWRGAGVASPVFSLRSRESVGAGEFMDLKLMVDFAAKTGMRLVQLLPINDTSVNMMWWDSYPYSSLSVFALHPLYLRLQRLSDHIPDDIKEEIENFRQKLDLKDVDYEATLKAKLEIAKKMFHLEKDKVLNLPSFKQYFEENKEWLKPYAAFCFLRDLFGTADHSQWGGYSEFTWQKVEKLVSPNSDYYDAIAFTYYQQFHLHSQLTEVAEYAQENRVVLKGDLPIGVDPHSVDTWQFPSLFRMNTSTGAPPDYFDMNGQNWGFPTYNWEEMAKDNFGWWRARLNQMAKYFSAYRIDHVLGFFRIWELPHHSVTGLMGHFRPSIPLSTEELEWEGVWDFNRLSLPYVRCHILQQKFGDRWQEIASKYFYEYEHLCYQASFKEEYNTEKKILAAIKPSEGSPDWVVRESEEIKAGLFDLLHEVVLMRDTEDPTKFYPRFNLDQTKSFSELDDHNKAVLRRLYHSYYFQRQEQLWRENALKTLPALMKSSDMLACGEDLGMVPDCVRPVLNELGLLGLRIQRYPSTPGQEFGDPAEYNYMVVCAPSCHDSSTMRAWWEEDEGRRSRFFKNTLGFSEPPPATCDPRIAHIIIQQHLEAPSVWAIFPIQDLLALKEDYTKRPAREEIINDPTNPRHYWRFRLHIPMEAILGDEEYLKIVRELVLSSGRASLKDVEATI
ncbi:unnamed protein product [Sphagnum jensenii]|uniref:4-alpha-glucanotransferase n=1 Tax=Sphagnum jensenii TaxID=128206 RepID=A0ABP0XJC0_9BRYO